LAYKLNSTTTVMSCYKYYYYLNRLKFKWLTKHIFWPSEQENNIIVSNDLIAICKIITTPITRFDRDKCFYLSRLHFLNKQR